MNLERMDGQRMNSNGERAIRVAVLGGGISGCVVAGELSRDPRFQITLIERDDRLGGLHRSVAFEGLVFDIGPFLFPPSHTLFRTFPRAVDVMVRVQSEFQSLTRRLTIDKYPVSIRGYLRDQGVRRCIGDAVSVLWSKWKYHRRDSLPAYAKYYLGERFYEESGLRDYIERMYGIPDADVALEFARQRMSLIAEWASLRRIGAGFLTRRKTVFNASPVTPNDLVRPFEGFETLYRNIQRDLEAAGVQVATGERLTRIEFLNGGYALSTSQGTECFDQLVSTIPLETLAQLIGLDNVPDLSYVPLYSLFYCFRGEPGFSGTLLHNFTQTGMWKRITMFSALYGRQEGADYFVAEGTIHDRSARELAELRHDFETHVRRAGLFSGELMYLGGVTTSHAYPVYDDENLARASTLKKQLQSRGIHLTGRQGEFDYISSADAAASAFELAMRLRTAVNEFPTERSGPSIRTG